MPTFPTLFLALLCVVTSCRADETEVLQKAHKPLKPRSAALSGVLEWAIPMAGHVYAGNPVRGILPNVCRVGGAVIVYAEIASAEIDGYDRFDYNETRVMAAQVLTFGGTAWAIWSAIDTATDRNESIRMAGLQPMTGWLPDGTATVGLCYSF